MTVKDWVTIGVGTFLLVVLTAIAILISRAERRREQSSDRLFSDAQAALWSIAIGVALVGLGAFSSDSTDVTTFFVGLGASGDQDARMEIEPGTVLEATTASGAIVTVRAISKPKRGRDFPVVWVCTEDEYARSQAAGEHADGLPWPLSAIRVPEHA